MLQLKQDLSKDVTCGLKSKWSEVAATKGAQEIISGKGWSHNRPEREGMDKYSMTNELRGLGELSGR